MRVYKGSRITHFWVNILPKRVPPVTQPVGLQRVPRLPGSRGSLNADQLSITEGVSGGADDINHPGGCGRQPAAAGRHVFSHLAAHGKVRLKNEQRKMRSDSEY